MKNYPACKELKELIAILCSADFFFKTNFLKIFQKHFQSVKKKTFCGFSMGSNQYWAGTVYDLCVYFMTGTPEGSTESGFQMVWIQIRTYVLSVLI